MPNQLIILLTALFKPFNRNIIINSLIKQVVDIKGTSALSLFHSKDALYPKEGFSFINLFDSIEDNSDI